MNKVEEKINKLRLNIKELTEQNNKINILEKRKMTLMMIQEDLINMSNQRDDLNFESVIIANSYEAITTNEVHLETLSRNFVQDIIHALDKEIVKLKFKIKDLEEL